MPEKKLINWQLPMKRVLYAVSPLVAAGFYFFGWRALFIVLISNLAGFITEYMFLRKTTQPVTSAVFVSSTLFALSLPPAVPYWMAVTGIVFGIVFGKMVFGGFGKNVFNPALTGRAFIYVSFGIKMTGSWTEPFKGAAGGLASFASDAVTSATPGMLNHADHGLSLMELAIGRTSGCIGSTSVILAVLGGIYLIWKKTANSKIVISAFAAYLLTQSVLWYFGIRGAENPLYSILSGSAVAGFFFYATDPVTASKTDPGRIYFGAFIGLMSSLITTCSTWPEGTMFAILLANMFAPITDYAVTEHKKRKKAKA